MRAEFEHGQQQLTGAVKAEAEAAKETKARAENFIVVVLVSRKEGGQRATIACGCVGSLSKMIVDIDHGMPFALSKRGKGTTWAF